MPAMRGREKCVPVEQHIAAPVHAPYSAHWRNHPLLLRLEDRVPSQRRFNRIQNRSIRARRFDPLFVSALLFRDRRAYLIQCAPLLRADSYWSRQVSGEIRTQHWSIHYRQIRFRSFRSAGAINDVRLRHIRPRRSPCNRRLPRHNLEGPIPKISNADHNRWRQRVGLLVLERRHKHHQSVAILARMCALDPPPVPLPLHRHIRVASIPGMRPRRHRLRTLIESPNQRITQPRIPILRSVVLHPDMNCQTLRQQNLGRHAVHIPRVPSPRQAALQLLVGLRRRRNLRLTLNKSRLSQCASRNNGRYPKREHEQASGAWP